MRPTVFFLAAALGLVSGCTTSYNPATEQTESLLISTEREVEMGNSISRQVDKRYPPVRDPELLARLDRIGQRIADVADRKDLVYQFGIIEEEEPNAFALPGGFVYVTTGLIKLVKSDDELASVLAHEVGHVTARHIAKKIQGQLGLQALQILAIAGGAASRDPRAGQAVNLAVVSVLSAYSQQDEMQADRLGVRYLKAAGFDPNAAVTFLQRMQQHAFKQPSHQFSYFRTHPFFGDRIQAARKAATGQIHFDDYINTNTQ